MTIKSTMLGSAFSDGFSQSSRLSDYSPYIFHKNFLIKKFLLFVNWMINFGCSFLGAPCRNLAHFLRILFDPAWFSAFKIALPFFWFMASHGLHKTVHSKNWILIISSDFSSLIKGTRNKIDKVYVIVNSFRLLNRLIAILIHFLAISICIHVQKQRPTKLLRRENLRSKCSGMLPGR